jgi:hypothetical protein
MSAAAGPAMRTTPRPARPSGVAIATIVSVVVKGMNQSMLVRQFSERSPLFHRDDDRLLEGVADAFRRHRFELGHRKVNDATLVGIEWPNFLSQPRRLGLLTEEGGHVFQLRILAFAVAHAVDDKAPALAGLVAIDRGDDVLQRGERFPLPPNQRVAILAIEIDAEASRSRPIASTTLCTNDVISSVAIKVYLAGFAGAPMR